MISDVIHLSTSADLTGYTYTEVYAGALGTITLNGISVTMAATSSIEIIVRSITGDAGIYLLGRKKIAQPPTIING
jgi:hypothetical protein